MLRPALTAARLDPLPRCARITRPSACSARRNAAALFEEIFVRQSMKAVAPDAAGVVFGGNRETSGNGRHRVVERGIEARDLRYSGLGTLNGLNQRDFVGQMVRRKRHHAPEIGEQRRRDPLRIVMHRAAVNDAMPDGSERAFVDVCVHPVHEPRDARGADTLYCTAREGLWTRFKREQRAFHARRAAVDGKRHIRRAGRHKRGASGDRRRSPLL